MKGLHIFNRYLLNTYHVSVTIDTVVLYNVEIKLFLRHHTHFLKIDFDPFR